MIVLDVPALAALTAIAVLAWRFLRDRRAEAHQLLRLDLQDDVADRREAAAALGLSPKGQERLLRRYYGGAAWRLIQAAEARQWSRGPAGDPTGPQSDRGPDHD